MILIEHLPEPLVNVDDEEVSPVMSKPSWMDPFWDHLVDGTLPLLITWDYLIPFLMLYHTNTFD